MRNLLIGFCAIVGFIAVWANGIDKQTHRFNEFNKATVACLNNDAYIGNSIEDSRSLFAQCLDDYRMAGK